MAEKKSNNVKKLNLKGQDKKTFIYFCLLFYCSCQSLASAKKMLYSTEIWQFPKNSWFLKILVLNCSATSQATRTQCFWCKISSIALLLANKTYIQMLQDFIISCPQQSDTFHFVFPSMLMIHVSWNIFIVAYK